MLVHSIAHDVHLVHRVLSDLHAIPRWRLGADIERGRLWFIVGIDWMAIFMSFVTRIDVDRNLMLWAVVVADAVQDVLPP